MTLFRALKEIVFGTKIRPDEIAKLAINAGARELFLSKLFDEGFIILGKPEEPSEVKDTDEIEFFSYEENGETIFPIFSSADMAIAFIYNPNQETVLMCPYYEVKIDVLLNNDFANSKVVLNPKTPYRREITSQDILDLRKMGER